MKRIALIFVLAILFFSCGKDDVDEQTLIQEYVTENGINAQERASGLWVEILEPGQDEKPTLESTVTVHYTGKYLDGTKFDSSFDSGQAAVFPLEAVIEGWQEGIPLFGKDGRGLLIIPSDLGYGSDPPAGVRKDAVLVFEVFLIDFN